MKLLTIIATVLCVVSNITLIIICIISTVKSSKKTKTEKVKECEVIESQNLMRKLTATKVLPIDLIANAGANDDDFALVSKVAKFKQLKDIDSSDILFNKTMELLKEYNAIIDLCSESDVLSLPKIIYSRIFERKGLIPLLKKDRESYAKEYVRLLMAYKGLKQEDLTKEQQNCINYILSNTYNESTDS